MFLFVFYITDDKLHYFYHNTKLFVNLNVNNVKIIHSKFVGRWSVPVLLPPVCVFLTVSAGLGSTTVNIKQIIVIIIWL